MKTPSRPSSFIAKSALLMMAAIPAIVACAPSTFENLTGGTTGTPAEEKKDETAGTRSTDKPAVDPSLKSPRPIAPISISYVNTDRPKFRWELSEGSTGAVLELSRTRDFKEIVRTVVATGNEVVLGDEQKLEPGFWFWRLRGRNAAAEGQVKPETPVWELLVRGASAQKALEAPQGSIVDMNGDGEPDLVISLHEKPDDPNETTVYFQAIMLGRSDHTFSLDPGAMVWGAYPLPSLDYSLTGGTDLDGDGYPELVRTTLIPRASSPGEYIGFYDVDYGGAAGIDEVKTDEAMNFGNPLPEFSSAAIVQASGDVNGDGYGDFSVTLPTAGFTSLGGVFGPSQIMFFAPFFEKPAPTTPAPLMGGVDLDGDGFADVVMTSRTTASPLGYVRGSRDGRFDPFATVSMNEITPTKPTAFATGDFDGNGVMDIAFATQLKDGQGVLRGAVCVYTPNTKPLDSKNCYISTAAGEGFGVSLIAGDLDSDGRDDLVVGSTSGSIEIIKRSAADESFTSEVVAGTYRPYLTMVHPGRPTNARWVAIGNDGLSLIVFQGRERLQTLSLDLPWLVKIGNVLR